MHRILCTRAFGGRHAKFCQESEPPQCYFLFIQQVVRGLSKKPPKNNGEEQDSLVKEFTTYKQEDHYALRKHVKSLHYSISKSWNINRFPIVTDEESARKHSENISTLYDLGHGDRCFHKPWITSEHKR